MCVWAGEQLHGNPTKRCSHSYIPLLHLAPPSLYATLYRSVWLSFYSTQSPLPPPRSPLLFNGSNAMQAADHVSVTINYRMSTLGYLAHPAFASEPGGNVGNYGLLDHVAALTWVQSHIRGFGGDPGRVGRDTPCIAVNLTSSARDCCVDRFSMVQARCCPTNVSCNTATGAVLWPELGGKSRSLDAGGGAVQRAGRGGGGALGLRPAFLQPGLCHVRPPRRSFDHAVP